MTDANTNDALKFQITKAELHVPVATLKTKKK